MDGVEAIRRVGVVNPHLLLRFFINNRDNLRIPVSAWDEQATRHQYFSLNDVSDYNFRLLLFFNILYFIYVNFLNLFRFYS